MDLDALVHLLKPLVRLLDALRRRCIGSGFEVRTRLHINDELARQFKVNGIQPAG
jgi:hypothetical protein